MPNFQDKDIFETKCTTFFDGSGSWPSSRSTSTARAAPREFSEDSRSHTIVFMLMIMKYSGYSLIMPVRFRFMYVSILSLFETELYKMNSRYKEISKTFTSFTSVSRIVKLFSIVLSSSEDLSAGDLWSECSSFCSDMIYTGKRKCTMFYTPADLTETVSKTEPLLST